VGRASRLLRCSSRSPQARDRWGREAAGAIWDSAIVKIVLGGSANADDLADLSRLIGEKEVKEWSQTVLAGTGGRSVSSSTRRRPVLEPSEIRPAADRSRAAAPALGEADHDEASALDRPARRR